MEKKMCKKNKNRYETLAPTGESFTEQSVLVLGHGNAAFETADAVAPYVNFVHVIPGPSSNIHRGPNLCLSHSLFFPFRFVASTRHRVIRAIRVIRVIVYCWKLQIIGGAALRTHHLSAGCVAACDVHVTAKLGLEVEPSTDLLLLVEGVPTGHGDACMVRGVAGRPKEQGAYARDLSMPSF
jgi:hypothetical protein